MTSWAISCNANVDDDFFSTIKPESIWNTDNTLLPEIDPTSSTEPTTTTTTIVERRRIVDSSEGSSNTNTNTEHTEATTSQTIDALLAKELNALSFQQRESINEEIHGLNVGLKEIEETTELLKESFRKLQIELNTLQPDSFAYNRCQQLYGDNNIAVVGNKKRKLTYINTDEFRIMFLRCELFVVTKAARRIINFVELMYDLYGDIGLQRRIRQDDLSKDELRVLKAGYTQLLPSRDRAGRRILIHIAYNSTNEFTAKSRLRIAYYTQMALADDIETQRKGAVQITWYHNVNIFDDFSTRGKVYSTSANCLPVRTGAIHICIPEELEDTHYMTIPGFTANNNRGSDDSSSENSSSVTSNNSSGSLPQSRSNGTPANIIKSMFALSIGGKLRSKLRIHTGSVIECLYALQSFGIPSSQIPLVGAISSHKKRKRKTETKRKSTPNGGKENNSKDLKLDNHNKWLELCQLKERNMTLFDKKWKSYGDNNYQPKIIECPNHSDILSGRGNGVNRHPGNTVLQNIVVSKLDEYMNLKSSVNEITKLTWDVVHLLRNEYGARFLKEETIESNGKLGCWIEVSNEEARLKVRIAFRDKIKVQQQLLEKQKKLKEEQHQQIQMVISSSTVQPPNMMMSKAIIDSSSNRNLLQKEDGKSKILPPLIAFRVPSFSLPSSSLSSTATPLILDQPKNSSKSLHHNPKIKKETQEVEEDTYNSSTSMFLSMTGNGSGGGGCGNTNNSTIFSTEKKRHCIN